MVRVLVVSPYPTVRAGLRALLLVSGEVDVVGEAEGAHELGDPWPVRPDVVLVDDAGGPAVLETLEARAPELGIVLLSDEPTLDRDGRRSAPRGYLTHDASAEELVSAVQAVAQGLTVVDPALVPGLLGAGSSARAGSNTRVEEALTPRELEVLQLLAAGLPNKTIALRLGISEHTAKFHVSSVLAKLGAASRTEAVTTAARQGLLLL